MKLLKTLKAHIRKHGRVWDEWCVGTAKDCRGTFFQRHREADLGDELTYREAYTTDAAQAVFAHLVNDRGVGVNPTVTPSPSPAKSFSSTARVLRRPQRGANTLPSAGSPHSSP